VKVSIISLIYRSATLADWVHDSVHKFTPLIARGEAEFFFVANDPTPGLVAHLDQRGYPYVVNNNKQHSDEELFALGYGAPEHMSRVYRGYNEGVRHAKGDYVVLVNSDNYFSPDWLENLLKYSDRSKVISSTLVERSHPEFGVFPGAVQGEFGGTVAEFDEAGFLTFVSTSKKTGLRPGGAYMPSLFHRDIVIEAGLYPDGNIAGADFMEVARFGDEAFFDRLASLGVEHLTALDSISYHLKEGEREDAPAPPYAGSEGHAALDATVALTEVRAYPVPAAIRPVYDPLYPNVRHESLMAKLQGKPLGPPAPSAFRRAREGAARVLKSVGLLGVALAVLRGLRGARRILTRGVDKPSA
jgi:hypothetical protein